MKLILKRMRTRRLTADGVLTSEDGTRICDTAEYAPTMLREGTYTVKLRMHPTYRHRAPSLGSGFLIHGNGVHAKKLGASIILGDYLMPGVVIRSRPYFDRLVKRIEKAILRKQEVTLIICH